MTTYTYCLIIAVIISMLQVCTANPISDDDVTKLFSASELERAENAGISNRALLEGKSYGLTLDDMIQLTSLKESPEAKSDNVNHMTQVCQILVPGHKTAADFSDAQKINLMQILQSVLQVTRADELRFFATTGCAYLSQPSLYEMEASSFGLQLTSYMKFRLLKLKNQNGSGMERVYVAKKLCCIYGDRDNSFNWMRKLTFKGIPDEELNKFDERWTEFENTNTSKAFENVCDFLHSQNPSDDNCDVLDVWEQLK